MMNTSAEEMLHVNDDYMQQHISKVLPNFNMERVLENDQEIAFQDKVFILNMTPILENKSTVGVVCSFRDKTELQNLVNTISEVRKYSEDLRAQTHEFTNKLFVLSGLLQLGITKKQLNLSSKNLIFIKAKIIFYSIKFTMRKYKLFY